MRWILVLGLSACLSACDRAPKCAPLFDGKSLQGWRAVSDANWRVEDGAIVVDSGERGLLVHEESYQDYELELEFKAAAGTNSGIFLSTTEKPASVTSDCYELNIAPEDNPFPTGSLVGRQRCEENVTAETDSWRKFKVTVEGTRVQVELDGAKILDYTAVAPASGNLIGLQKNEGRVAFRKLHVKRL